MVSQVRRFPRHECDHSINRIQIGWNELPILDLEPVTPLEEGHELQHAGRVDDSPLEQRLVAGRQIVMLAEQKVLADELAYLCANGFHCGPC